jgi:hypothetical protein
MNNHLIDYPFIDLKVATVLNTSGAVRQAEKLTPIFTRATYLPGCNPGK